MKRFLLFTGTYGAISGGLEQLYGDFNTFSECCDVIDALSDQPNFFHILDIQQGKKTRVQPADREMKFYEF